MYYIIKSELVKFLDNKTIDRITVFNKKPTKISTKITLLEESNIKKPLTLYVGKKWWEKFKKTTKKDFILAYRAIGKEKDWIEFEFPPIKLFLEAEK